MKPFFKLLTFAAVIVLCIMTARTAMLVMPQKPEKADTTAGVAYLTALESVTPAQAEKTIRDAREARDDQTAQTAAPADSETETQPADSETETQPVDSETDSLPQTPTDTSNYTEKQKDILDAINDGNFDYAFRDILVVGDSLVKGLTEYEKLDSSYVIAEIGGGTYYLEEIEWDIININPRYLFIHIGENELDDEDYCPYFIERYHDCLVTLKDYLPDTDIYVESIFPVLDHALDDEPYLVNIDYYNSHLREMAEELGVHYVDYDPVFASFPRSYYEQDGIHQLPEFYTEQYMPHILKEVYFSD